MATPSVESFPGADERHPLVLRRYQAQQRTGGRVLRAAEVKTRSRESGTGEFRRGQMTWVRPSSKLTIDPSRALAPVATTQWTLDGRTSTPFPGYARTLGYRVQGQDIDAGSLGAWTDQED